MYIKMIISIGCENWAMAEIIPLYAGSTPV